VRALSLRKKSQTQDAGGKNQAVEKPCAPESRLVYNPRVSSLAKLDCGILRFKGRIRRDS